MATTIERVRAAESKYNQAMSELMGKAGEIDILREAFSSVVQAVIAADDEGWSRLNGANENVKGISLEDSKKLAPWLESEVKKSGGLLGRALRLKNNHIFGRGFTFEPSDRAKIAPRHQAILDDPDNQASVFSNSAAKKLNRILFTSGNLFILYNEKQKTFDVLAIDLHIENSISYPDDPSKLKYILREYVNQDDVSGLAPKKEYEWIPTVNYRERLRREGAKLPDSLPRSGQRNAERAPVRQDAVIIEKRINNDNGDIWGVPDAFSAAPWALLYSNYLRDAAKLQAALAAIAFVVKAKTQAAAKAAGARIQNARVGQAVITGTETEVDSIPRAGSVDLYEGRPIAAMVAASLDVSTTGLTSDPGPGGSYASENALSQPEQLAALSRQEDFADIYAQIFRAMGASYIVMNANRIDTDPIHRQLQSLGLAYTMGGINQEELRARTLELLDIAPTSKDLPEPNEFIWAKRGILPSFLNDDEELADLNAGGGTSGGAGNDGALDSGLASPGNADTIGSLDDGNDARDSDRDAGTA